MSHASDEDYADGLVFTGAGFDFFMEKVDSETQDHIRDTGMIAGLPYLVRPTFHMAKMQSVIRGMCGLDYATVFAPEEMADHDNWHDGTLN